MRKSPFCGLLLLLASPSAPAPLAGGKKITLLDFFPSLNVQDTVNTYLPTRSDANPGNLVKVDVRRYSGQIPMAALFGVDCRTMHPPLTVKERNDFPLRSNPPFSCADVTGVLLFQLVIGRPKFPPTTSQLTEEALAALKPDRYGVPVAASVSKEIFWVSRVNKGSLSLDGRLYYIEPVLKNPTFRSVPYNLGGGPFPVVQMNAFASFSPPDAPGDWDAGEEKAAAFFAEAEVWAKENRGRDKPPIAERYIRHWADAVRGDALRPSEWVSEVYVPWVSVLKHQLAWDIKHREEIMKAWPEYEFPPEAGVSKM